MMKVQILRGSEHFISALKFSRFVAPIRKNEEGEFFLESELGADADHATALAKKTDEPIPQWAAANPVQRYQPVRIAVIAD